MSTITNEQRDAAYAAATEQQKILCSSPESGLFLQTIAAAHQIPDEKYLAFVLIAGDTVLGLRNRSDMPQFLQIELQITSEKALQITGDLIDFMEGKQPLPTATADSASTSSPHQVPPVRTMAGDMAKIQGNQEVTYTSTQEAILTEGRLGK